jgi:hypothetical protein
MRQSIPFTAQKRQEKTFVHPGLVRTLDTAAAVGLHHARTACPLVPHVQEAAGCWLALQKPSTGSCHGMGVQQQQQLEAGMQGD